VTELDKQSSSLDRELEQPISPCANTQEAEDDFAQFFAHSLDLLCSAGLDDGYLKRLNPAWTTNLGWRVKDLLGKPFIDFVHADDRESTLAEVARLADGEAVICFENRCRHLDGSYIWLHWHARPHPSRRRIYAVGRDMTQRMRHEQEILEIVDRERGRLGRDMHDGLCQTLAGIAALSATLSRKLAATVGSDVSARADEINKLLKDAIGDARDMARGLDPIGLDAAGLGGALETLAINVERLFHISCSAESHYSPGDLHREVKTHLFRIAQEAVNNSVVHGRANRIAIKLNCDDSLGVLSISDNGTGLPDDWSDAKGMGMRTMAYRAGVINARLDVQASDAQGTTVTCTFPLPA